MALADGDLINVAFRGKCFGQRIILSRMFKVIGPFPLVNTLLTDLQLIVTAVSAAGVNDIQTPYLACLPATYTLEEVRAQRWKPTRTAYQSQFPVGAIGTNANPATVANDSGALTFRTALAGRSQVGTCHIGPAPDGASAAGLLTNAYKALLGTLGVTMASSFIPPTSGSLLVPVLWNRKLNTTEFIIAAIVGAQSRVQRRRTVGIGE